MSSRKCFLVVISSPSGGGKSTLVAHLLTHVPHTRLSVSCTTRPPRPSEIEGVHYHFISRAEFERRRDAGDFLEWAEVFGHLYGTSRRMVDEFLAGGCDVLLDIDVQGAAQIRQIVPDAVSVFVLPPSFSVLEQRLIARSVLTREAPETLERRLQTARREVLHYAEFQYLVINDHLEEACRAVESIVRAERQKRARLDDEAQAILRTFQEESVV